jgi:hypothetical protein
MTKPRRWRKEFPYFKVQLFDPLLASWKDERGIFDTAEAAASHINRQPSNLARIIVVESETSRSVHPGSAVDSPVDLPQSHDPNSEN